MGSKGRRWAWLGAGVLIVSAGLAAERAARTSLERRAREIDLVAAVRSVGLEGRVSVPRWEQSTLRWFPRPALRLGGVEASVLSGQPGPGASSGRVRFATVDLVPTWGFPLRHGLERVEVRGGRLEVGRDLLPPVPREYLDPLSGTRRPIPWSSLLRVIEEGGGAHSATPARTSRLRPRLLAREPALLARDLEISLPAEFLPVGESVEVGEARLFASGDRLEVTGELRVRAEGRSWSVPIWIARESAGPARDLSWDLSLGSDSSGVRLRVEEATTKRPLTWSGEIRDPIGALAQSFLEGRAGPLGRIEWRGPWSLEVGGEGLAMSGVREATVRFRGGVLSLAGATTPRTAVSGTARILPGRVDVTRLVLLDGAGAGRDSAEVRLQWLSTSGGQRLTGRLSGALDPAWLGILGPRWGAAGRVQASVSIDGATDGLGGSWSIVPHGRLDGTFEKLRSPWFADSLAQGSLEAWGAEERVGFVLAGTWGGSPFRLEARDLPLADPRRADYALDETRWDFTSPSCRVEAFRLAPERFPEARDLPFWLALPGRGEMRIDHGTVLGVAFDSLSAGVERQGTRFHVDHFFAALAGGSVSGTSAPAGGRRSGSSGGETRFEVERLDLGRLRPVLERIEPRLAHGVDGRLSGNIRLRWPGRDEPVTSALPFDGALRVSNGRLRGLAVQEELRRRTHLDQLGTLSFGLLQADVRRDQGSIRWNRVLLEAPPFRVEGAGRSDPGDSIRFVLSIRTAGGSTDDLGRLLALLAGGENAAVYALLSGPTRQPDVQVISRAGFLRELDRLDGKLPTDPEESRH